MKQPGRQCRYDVDLITGTLLEPAEDQLPLTVDVRHIVLYHSQVVEVVRLGLGPHAADDQGNVGRDSAATATFERGGIVNLEAAKVAPGSAKAQAVIAIICFMGIPLGGTVSLSS
jgi:hypothetical protein